MIHHPAVIIHGLPHAELALAAGRPVTLLSARGAAIYAGCAWWANLVALARARYPAVPMTDMLDCADAPGRAMAALRIGQKLIRLDPGPALPDVTAAAESVGARVFTLRPPALDLARRQAARQLAAWLDPG